MKIKLVSGSNQPDGYGTLEKKWLKYSELDLKTDDEYYKYALAFGYPNKQIKAEKVFYYTMWESTGLPNFFIKGLKGKKIIKTFVPSQFCQNVFKAHGIDAELIPLGYDPEDFYPLNTIEPFPEYTFLHYDAFNTRKGWRKVFEAFNMAFGEEDDVKLIFKTIKENTIPLHEYPKIQVIKAKMSFEALNKLINRCDCFVFPSMGEGFGLTPLENMACGKPVIVPNEHGISHYFNPRVMMEVDTHPRDALYASLDKESWGKMFECDKSDLAKKMFEIRRKRHYDPDKIMDWARQYNIKKTIKETDKRIKCLAS